MAARRPLTVRAQAEFKRWQRTLPPAKRADLRRWREPPFVLVATPVDAELARENEQWTAELREYVNSHEEIDFFLREYRGHICRAHADARRVIDTGVIPPGFRCPRDAASCPFASASALAAGQALHLVTRDGTARRAGS
jgi:hypothetical protein